MALDEERRHGDLVRALIRRGQVRACHDVGDGGLLVAVAEMALAGGIGATLAAPAVAAAPHAIWFGEDQGRYVLAVEPHAAEAVLAASGEAGVAACRLGTSGGNHLTLEGGDTISLTGLRLAHEGWLPAYMAGSGKGTAEG